MLFTSNSTDHHALLLAHKTFGTLTYGRQNSLILDNLEKYDPQAQAKAFSPIAYSGVSAGGGDTEEKRLDNSLKYVVGYGPAHLAYLHQFRNSGAIRSFIRAKT